MVAETQYLDWKNLFFNDIAGGEVTIFVSLSFILIMFLAAQFRFPNSVTIAIMIVYGIIFSVFFNSLLILTMLIIGILFYFAINRIMEAS